MVDDDVLAFLLSLDVDTPIDELCDVFASHVQGFNGLTLPKKSDFVRRFRSALTAAASGEHATVLASGGSSDSSSPPPVDDSPSAVSSDATSGRGDDDLEEISLEIPASLLPGLDQIRTILGDTFGIEVVVDALVRSSGDVTAAVALLLDEQEAVDGDTARQYADEALQVNRLMGALRGDTHRVARNEGGSSGGCSQRTSSSSSVGSEAPLPRSSRPSQRSRFKADTAAAAAAFGAHSASPFVVVPSPGGAKRHPQTQQPPQPQPPEARGGTQPAPTTTPAGRAALASIRAMFPDVTAEEGAFALSKCGGNGDAAVMYILGGELATDFAIFTAAASRGVVQPPGGAASSSSAPLRLGAEDDAARLQDVAGFKALVMRRYDETVDTSGKTYSPKIAWGDANAKGVKQRFLDGQSVWMKRGERGEAAGGSPIIPVQIYREAVMFLLLLSYSTTANLLLFCCARRRKVCGHLHDS